MHCFHSSIWKLSQKYMKTTYIILLLAKCYAKHHILAHTTNGHYNYPEATATTTTGPKHKHVIPTLLSVQDHVTKEHINALHNSLYEELKESTFVRPRCTSNNEPSSQLRRHGQQKDLLSSNNQRQLSPLISSIWEKIHSALSLFQQRQQNDPVLEPVLFLANKQYVTFQSTLTLSWNDNGITDDDVITLHCPADDNDANFKDAATIIQARTMGRPDQSIIKNDDFVASHAHNESSADSAHVSHWEFRFPIIREDSCEFRLWSRKKNKLHLLSKTESIRLPNARHTPTAIHLSLTSSPDTINIHFTTGHFNHTTPDVTIPVVQYSSSTSFEWLQATGTSDTYSAADMCEAPANVTEAGKFVDPGLLHTVPLSNLDHDTEYSYRVGVTSNRNDYDNIVWSQIHSFKSPSPPPEKLHADYKIKFLAYGDQGVPGGWCCNASANITAMVAKEVTFNDIRAVHHIGDISYAKGAAHLWDLWFGLIQPFSTKVPLMVGIGNHEYDHVTGGENGKDPSGEETAGGYHPRWGNMNGTDSGGECGVPVHKRFLMPSTEGSNGVFWYSYDMAMIHVVMISSEHDLSPGSRQYKWLERDLKRVNRMLTPWVLLESHRPMYHSNNQTDQRIVAYHMRDEFEELLYKHRVDVFLSGHMHSYLRTCPGLYKSRCHRKNGILHITVGTAGIWPDAWDLYRQDWTEVYLRVNGYGRVEVNRTNFLFEFIGSEEKAVLDRFMLTKG